MRKLDLETVLKRIQNRCKEKNYEFLGFCDKSKKKCEWYGVRTYLKLHCNKCGNDWDSTEYQQFIGKRKTCCPNCGKITEDEALDIISKKCFRKNYSFNGFCDKNQNDYEWNGAHKTYLRLHCNTCGKDWCSSFGNFYNIKMDRGCPKCTGKSLSNKEHIEIVENECKKRNYDFLGFCKKNGKDCEYKTAKTTYLKLHCNKCGNYWNTTSYDKFIQRRGCPVCLSSKLEEEIRHFLKDENVEEQKKFDWLKNGKGQQSLDFYLPQYNIAIECQGIQHFQPSYFGGITKEQAQNNYKTQIERDKKKKQLCKEHGIHLLYYSNLGINYPYKVFENKEELLKEIKEKYEINRSNLR